MEKDLITRSILSERGEKDMGYRFEMEYFKHCQENPDHVLEYIDDCGLAHFKDGCIEDWS